MWQPDRWTHVAMSYRADAGRLRVYVDGARVHEQRFPAGPIDASSDPLVVGPGGQRPLAPQVPAGQPVLALDEVLVSRVERTAAGLDSSRGDVFQALRVEHLIRTRGPGLMDLAATHAEITGSDLVESPHMFARNGIQGR